MDMGISGRFCPFSALVEVSIIALWDLYIFIDSACSSIYNLSFAPKTKANHQNILKSTKFSCKVFIHYEVGVALALF
jgi:hypothetical protein